MNLFTENETPISFTTNYDGILARMKSINPIKYAKTRNFIDGDVTYLSPYISRGVITLNQIKEYALSQGYKPYQIQNFLQELAWREYFQRVWQAKAYDIYTDLKQPQADVLHYKMLNALQHATTEITAIDQHINLLYQCGYMHNHVRMYVASLTCNIAKAHWLAPSKWMYYHLLDGDIASNNCSWQWVAGAFASKKYYFNQDNVDKYTNTTQRNSYLNIPYENITSLAVPHNLSHVEEFNSSTPLPTSNFTTLDVSLKTLIYNSYNLDPQWRKDEQCNRVLLLEPSHFTQNPVSQKVIDFILSLSQNIEGIKIFVGEFNELLNFYKGDKANNFIYKEHPTSRHYKGLQDERDWMFPSVTGFYNSFFSYWKKCERYLK
jgi:deoxyribodipyrimidine photo-lyase